MVRPNVDSRYIGEEDGYCKAENFGLPGRHAPVTW
jgi:hypothetical protein